MPCFGPKKTKTMIRRLHIQNYAIIEEVDIHFSRGLTIITGETGAGKSILLGALGLIMGRRADTKVLYQADKKCVVEAWFDIQKYDLQPFFDENDLDYESDVVIRRELAPSGKSRAFINDSPVKLPVLQELTAALIDLHQQFDTLDIQEETLQMKMLDALSGNKRLLQSYRELYASFQTTKRQLSSLEAQIARSEKEESFLNFQLEELETANLVSGEQESLEEEYELLSNAEEIKQVCGSAFAFLSENENAIVSQLQDVNLSVNQVKKYHGKIEGVSDRLHSVLLELQDAAAELETIADDVEFNPARQQEVKERLDLIYRLQAKHQVQTIDQLLDIQANLSKQIEEMADQSGLLPKLKEQLRQQEKDLWELAGMLREKRLTVIPEFEKSIENLLADLSMLHARLTVDLQPHPDLLPTGADLVQFMFTANVGTKPQPIREVASGGELSRLALVTKSLVASAIPLPTLIFDEIDTGISGDVALKMGKILRKLSDAHQVVSITHSPQVASRADTHYFIYKNIVDNRTVTSVRELQQEDRVTEIAIMLSSNPPSEAALVNARELLQRS